MRFKVGGHQFDVERLELFTALDNLGPVLELAAPVVIGLQKSRDFEAIAKAVSGSMKQLSPLLRVFLEVTKWKREDRWVELQPFLDEVFGSRPELAVLFLAHCIKQEYAGFLLDGSLMEEAAGSLFESPAEPAAKSGESS